jgi:hypothetical protein
MDRELPKIQVFGLRAGEIVHSAHDLRTLRTVESLVGRIAEAHWRTDERLRASSPVEDQEELLRSTARALRNRGMQAMTAREM